MTDPEDEAPDSKPGDFQPGTYGCHEALHMALFLAESVDEQLCEHPAIQLQPEWHKLAEEAFDKLYDLYQAIGREHLMRIPEAGRQNRTALPELSRPKRWAARIPGPRRAVLAY